MSSGSPAARYDVEQVWASWSEQLLDWGADFHELLLGDKLRMRAYQRAISEVVWPGAIVCDLGTGTGVLARWALEAGATRVYGIERDGALLEGATAALGEAGFGNRFVPTPGLSFDVELPERVGLIVSEILGNLVDNEDCTRVLDDAVRRFLTPGGQLLPRRVERYFVPVDAPRAHAAVAAVSAARPFDAYYDVILPRAGYLASPRVDRIFSFDGDACWYRSELVFAVDRPGCLTGFKGWFVADLSPTVALDISSDHLDGLGPMRTTSDSWKHAYLPVETPVMVEPHDRILLAFERLAPGKANGAEAAFAKIYRWTGAVWRHDREITHFAHHS